MILLCSSFNVCPTFCEGAIRIHFAKILFKERKMVRTGNEACTSKYDPIHF